MRKRTLFHTTAQEDKKKDIPFGMSFFLAPRAGLEPATSWLTVMRSTDWANEDYDSFSIQEYLFVFSMLSSCIFYAFSQYKIHGRSELFTSSVSSFRRRSIFPGSCPPSIVAAKELNFRVREGNGWDLLAMTTGFNLESVPSKLNNNWHFPKSFRTISWSSPRPISITQLHTLLHLHLWPINLIVYKGSY